MENARRQGKPANQRNLMEDLEKLTAKGLDEIQQGLSQGTMVITESSVFFIFNLEWKKARKMAYHIMGPGAIARAMKNAENSRQRPALMCMCDAQAVCEILSTKFNSSELAKSLKRQVSEKLNLLPIIMPTEAIMAISYIEIPRTA